MFNPDDPRFSFFHDFIQSVHRPVFILRQNEISKNFGRFHANAAGAEIPLNPVKERSVGGIMQVYGKLVGKHELDTAHGIVGPGILAEPEGKTVGVVGRPVYGVRVELPSIYMPVLKYTDASLIQVRDIFLELGQDILHGDGGGNIPVWVGHQIGHFGTEHRRAPGRSSNYHPHLQHLLAVIYRFELKIRDRFHAKIAI